MKNIIIEFFKRGCIGCGLGPIVLAILYLILYHQGMIDTLTVPQVCIGVLSLTLLAFVASGINVIYQIETCPLIIAIFIHGCVLYVGYLITYLLNDWLVHDKSTIIYFTFFFILGYLVIWLFIYKITKKNTEQLNQILSTKTNKTND